MRKINRKWWLTAVALLLLVPVASARPLKGKPKHRQFLDRPDTESVTVPESGSGLLYVVGAGTLCLGAMLMRSRSIKPE